MLPMPQAFLTILRVVLIVIVPLKPLRVLMLVHRASAQLQVRLRDLSTLVTDCAPIIILTFSPLHGI